MSQNSNTLRNTIIGTVVGSLIVSVILWLVGYLPAIFKWLGAIFEALWNFVTMDIPSPVWLLFILIILGIPVLWRVSIKIISTFLPSEPTVETNFSITNPNLEENTAPQFTENELLILQVLVKKYGSSLYLHSVSQGVNLNELRTEQALDSLMSKNLVKNSLSYLYGTSYFLSSRGRDVAIELGYA